MNRWLCVVAAFTVAVLLASGCKDTQPQKSPPAVSKKPPPVTEPVKPPPEPEPPRLSAMEIKVLGLIDELKGGVLAEQVQAAKELGELGADAAAAVDALAEAVGSTSAQLYQAALAALGQIGPPARKALPAMAARLPNTVARKHVRDAFLAMGPEIIDDLLSLIRADAGGRRLDILRAVGDFGDAASGQVDALAEMLSDDGFDSSARRVVARTLVQIGPAADDALYQAMLSDDPKVSRSAGYGARQQPGLRVYVRAARTAPSKQRLQAMGFLASGKDRTEVAMPVLGEALGDSDPVIRQRAAYCLGNMGPRAQAAGPALVKALTDPDWPVRKTAPAALAKIGCKTPAAIEALAKVLQEDPNSTVRLDAALALVKLAPEGMGPVIAASKVPSRETRMAAVDALKWAKPADDAVVTALVAATRDEYQRVRERAVEALCRARPVSPKALTALAAFLKGSDSSMRSTTAYFLIHLGPEGAPLVAALTAALRDRSSAVRGYSARALGAMGPPAAKALPALEQMKSQDKLPGNRQTAEKAIGKIKAAS